MAGKFFLGGAITQNDAQAGQHDQSCQDIVQCQSSSRIWAQIGGVEQRQEHEQQAGWRRLPEHGTHSQPVAIPQRPGVCGGMRDKEHADQSANQGRELPGPKLVDNVHLEEQAQTADQADEQ